LPARWICGRDAGQQPVHLPDLPYLENYRVDYPNIQRNSAISISTSTNGQHRFRARSIGWGHRQRVHVGNYQPVQQQFLGYAGEQYRDMLRETDKVIPASAAATATTSRKRQRSRRRTQFCK
jgi:general secretion pathway protein D